MTEQRAIVFDDEIIECKKKYKQDIGEFQAIGRITNMWDKQEQKTDIFKHLRKLSKPAYDLFDDLKDTRDPKTNICFLSTDSLTASQLKMRRTRIKEIKDAGLIKKAKTVDKRCPIRKGSFMMNPKLIKCTYDSEKALELWDYLK